MTSYYNNLSEQEQLEAVQQDGCIIKHISNPTNRVQLAAVHQNSYSIRYISAPLEQIQLSAIKQDSDLIYYIAYGDMFKSTYTLALTLKPSLKNKDWFQDINKEDLR